MAGYKFPEILTCETTIKNSLGEKAHSQSNGSLLCLNHMDFYGKIQPEFIFINISIDGANNGSKPNLSYTGFKFGITAAHIELLKGVPSGTCICWRIVIVYCVFIYRVLITIHFSTLCNVNSKFAYPCNINVRGVV